MHHLLYRITVSVALSCIVASAISAILCSRLGLSIKKGKLRLLGYCLLSSGLTILGVSWIAYQESLPVYHTEGVIQDANVYRHSKDTHTRVHVLTASDGELVLDASGSSTLLHPGEHLVVTYRGETGSIIRATFLTNEGSIEGHFNGTDLWPAYFWLFLGVLFGYDGFQRHRRDPEGSEEPYRRNTVPLNGVDTASLLQLSSKHRKDSDV